MIVRRRLRAALALVAAGVLSLSACGDEAGDMPDTPPLSTEMPEPMSPDSMTPDSVIPDNSLPADSVTAVSTPPDGTG